MTRLQTVYCLAILIGLCATTIAYFMPVFPYTPDSACYIEQARSLLARGVFESGLYGTEKPLATFVPDPLFPPGYPVLIASFSLLLSVPPEVVALFLSGGVCINTGVHGVFFQACCRRRGCIDNWFTGCVYPGNHSLG
jgi:hypothetical protein